MPKLIGLSNASNSFTYFMAFILLICSCTNTINTNPIAAESKQVEIQPVERDLAINSIAEDEQDFSSLTFKIDFAKIDTSKLGDVDIVIRQDYPIESSFSCNSYITSFASQDTIDHLEFKFIESLGGLAGFSAPENLLGSLVLSKEGDYDGRTIVINGEGKIHSFIGGTNFWDAESGILFSVYSSDLPGISAFDIRNDSLLFSKDYLEDRPLSIHKAFENRFFIYCENDDTEHESIWEFEFDLERIMVVDLDSTTVNSSNKLPTINSFRF